jgi:hypothetical protein
MRRPGEADRPTTVVSGARAAYWEKFLNSFGGRPASGDGTAGSELSEHEVDSAITPARAGAVPAPWGEV